MPNPFDQFDGPAKAPGGNPFDQFEPEANAFDRFDDAGNVGGVVNAGRRAGRGALAGLKVMGALGAGAKRDDYLKEAERLEEQAANIDTLMPAWQPENRRTWAERAKGTAAQLRERAGQMDASATDALAGAVKQQRAAEAIPISEDYRKYQEAEGWAAVKQFLKNPVELPLTIAAEGAVGSVPTLIAGAAGAATAGVPGLVAGTGLGSFATEYAGSLLDTLREKGVDTEDAAALKAAFGDAELMAAARKRAVARGVPVAAFDAISGGLAGRTVAPVVRDGVKQILKAGAKEVAQQAGLGMAGETAGQVTEQLVDKGRVEKLDLGAIAAEGIGEIVPGAGQTAMGAASRVRDRRQQQPTNLRPPSDDNPATRPAPNPSPDATTGAPADALSNEEGRLKKEEGPASGTADIEAEMAGALPDAESREVLAVRSAEAVEAAERALAAVDTDFASTVKSVQDALLAADATPAQLDALDFQLSVLELKKSKRRLKPDQVNRSLGNTFLMEALPAAQVFPLVSRIAESVENVKALRAGIAAMRATDAENTGHRGHGAPTQSAQSETPGLTDEARAAKLAALQAREAEATAATQRAEVEQAAQREAAAKAEVEQRARIKAESTALATEEKTGRDASGKITDLTRVPDGEIDLLDPQKEGLTSAQIDAEMLRRAQAAERAAAAAPEGDARETLLDTLERLKLKLPSKDAALGGELKALGEEMNAGQRMRMFSAKAKGGLDTIAEALREQGFAWVQTPADVIAGVQRSLRGEKIFAERAGEAQFARRGQPDGNQTDIFAGGETGGDTLYNLRGEERDAATAQWSFDEELARREAVAKAKKDQGELPFARRGAPPVRQPAATRTAQQQEWWENFRRVAPALARQFELRFGEAADLVDEGAARASDLTGEEQAAYVARRQGAMRGMIYLFDRALRENTDAVSRLNLMHELGHAYWDTLDASTQEQLGGLWQREKDTKTGPLFDDEGNLRPNVARGVFDESDPEFAIREWFAERLAHANSEWAARRMGARARGDTLMHQIAADFRALLNAMREYLARAFGREGYGDALTGDFRKFLDQGARWEDVDNNEGGGQSSTYEQQAVKYVADNGTPAEHQAEAERDIARLLETAGNEQLDLFGYALPAAAAAGPEQNAARRLTAAEKADAAKARAGRAISSPLDTGALAAAFEDGDTISSIIPALVADPRRSWDIRGAKINSPRDLATLAQVMRTPYVETTKMVLVNASNVVVHSEIVAVGSLSMSLLDSHMMRQFLSRAPNKGKGLGLIIAHNHPSGNPEPSSADVAMTRLMRQAADTVGVPLRDHVITNGERFYSFAESGQIGASRHRVTSRRQAEETGAEATPTQQLGQLAPWETAPRSALSVANAPEKTRAISQALRQVDPTSLHVIYLTRQMAVTAMQRIPGVTGPSEKLVAEVMRTAGEQGASGIILIVPDGVGPISAREMLRDFRAAGKDNDVNLVDVTVETTWPGTTARAQGLLEPDGEYGADFARRGGDKPAADPKTAQQRFDQLRVEFDRVTAEALAIRAEMKPLWDSDEKGAETRLRALNDALTENEAITKKIYTELAELRAQLEQANPTKKELPAGTTLENLVAKENEKGEALKKESTEQLLRDYASTERTRDRYLENGERVPRHVLTALADLREALEESLPGWRERLARDKAATAADIAQGTTKPEGPEPEKGATALFDEGPEISPDATAAKRSQLEAGTLRRPQPLKQWLGNVGEWFRNFRSAIPELPGGAKGREFTRFRQGWRKMKAATERVRHDAMERVQHIVEPLQALGRDAVAPDRYRELQRLQEIRAEQIAAEKPVKPELKRRIAQIEAELESVPYHLFRKVVLYRDLFFRSRLEGPGGEPLRLPFSLTQGEVEASLRELHGRVAQSPHRAAIEEALKRHYALVKDVRDGLLARGYIIPEELRNPLYFPHLVLDKTSGQLTKVKLDTAEDFRGYLVRLVGSDRAIDTDYLTAMYHHLATVEAHNARQDIVEADWKPYDILAKLKEEAKEASERNRENGGGPVHWRALVPEGFTVMTVDDRIPIRPDLIINRGVLAQKLGVALGDGDLQARLRELGMSITLTAEDFEQAMTAGEKVQWVVPTPIADAMRGIIKRESDTEGALTRVLSGANGLWKRWTLFAPHNVFRYTYGNLVADMEKLFSADPKVLPGLLPAYREVRDFFAGGKPSADLRAAFERGVIDSVTADEVTTMTGELGDRFEAFLTRKEKLWQALAWVGRAGVALNRYREATFRYAKFRADLARMRAGTEPVYAGAFARDVRAIEEPTPEATTYARAAEISRKTFGDYDDISVSGAGLRKFLIPFYSWMEINFRYHANLFRNLGDMTLGAGAAQVARQTMTAASRVLVARSVSGVLLRLALPYVATALWNNTGDREELEKTLSEEDRRRFHIIIGKDAQGRTIVVYAPTALSDVMKWFGGNDFMRLAGEYARGEITLPQLAHEWASNVPKDAANNVAQSVGPLMKGAVAAGLRRSIFPDVFKPRTIADHDLGWAVLGNMVDGTTADVLRRAVDKDFYSSKDFETWAQQAILQARRRDPEQWGYYATLDKVAEYQAAHGGSVDFGTNNRADAALLRSFRQAIRAADVPAAVEFYQRLLETGYTAERFAASVRATDPLGTLKREHRKEFVDRLSEAEKTNLRNAYKYAERLKVFANREGQLFPRDRATPGYKAKFAAGGGRPDVLANVMERFAAESDAEVDARAERLMRESLRRK